MAHFKQLTWKQHLAYLSCAIALAFSAAAYQKESIPRYTVSRAQSGETLDLLKLRRSVKRLRSLPSSRSIALQMLRWESPAHRDRD